MSFSLTLFRTCTARSFCVSAASASDAPAPAAVEFVLARGRDDGGPPGAAVGSWAMKADGGTPASMIDGRRSWAAMRESRRSERKLGPGGEVLSAVRRQFKRGSWMNYLLVSNGSQDIRTIPTASRTAINDSLLSRSTLMTFSQVILKLPSMLLTSMA